MLIYPAIDLRGGRVVRLTQGDYDRMTVYADDPAEVARGFVRAGAACLHAVDLDGAKDGSPQNRAAIASLCALPLEVEVGGGMRTEARYEGLKQYILHPILARFAIPEACQPYYIAYYVEGIMAIVKEWLRKDCSDEVETVARIIEACVRPKGGGYET